MRERRDGISHLKERKMETLTSAYHGLEDNADMWCYPSTKAELVIAWVKELCVREKEMNERVIGFRVFHYNKFEFFSCINQHRKKQRRETVVSPPHYSPRRWRSYIPTVWNWCWAKVDLFYNMNIKNSVTIKYIFDSSRCLFNKSQDKVPYFWHKWTRCRKK